MEEGERDGDGDGTIVFAAGRKSTNKSGEVGYRSEDEEDDDRGESWADDVSLLVEAVGGVSWTMITPDGDGFGVQSDRGVGDGTSCAKVNGSTGPFSCVDVVSEGGGLWCFCTGNCVCTDGW